MFKVGDRVRVKMGLRPGCKDSPVWVAPSMCEKSGKTLTIDDYYGEGCYTMKECGFCWHESILEPINPPVCIPKPTWRIIIEGDENTSRAKYITGKKVIKEVSAKRYHTDKHDPAMAARALTAKMFPDTAKPDDPPKYFTGKVVCVEADTCMFEKGRIYDFSLNGGRGYNYLTCNTILGSPAKSVEEINQRLVSKFIEIKED